MRTHDSEINTAAGCRRPTAAAVALPTTNRLLNSAAVLTVACVWLVIGSGALVGQVIAATSPSSPAGANTAPDRETARRAALVQAERPAAATPTDLAARERFLAVERFARLGGEQQARQFPEFYRKLAPYFMNQTIEGILSSYPVDILDRRAYGNPGGDANARWAGQLADAAARLTPEEVADNLATRLWLDVAGRARTAQILKQHSGALAVLITEDLASQDLAAIQRACTTVGDQHLRQFTDPVLALYLADTPLSPPARTALVWLADPVIVRPLLEQVEKDPRQLVRHAGLFQGPLAGQPAEPILVKLLDAPDPDIRYHAASALSECNDAALAGPIARLAKAGEPRLQGAALMLALRLPDDVFAGLSTDLAPLLFSKDARLCLEAVTCFARHKNPLAGPPLLGFLKLDRIDAGQAVSVMQALHALAGSAFGYDLHNWGPTANRKAITRFETWLRQATVR
jgi:hypothetical protein